jgi:hypothetical protein
LAKALRSLTQLVSHMVKPRGMKENLLTHVLTIVMEAEVTPSPATLFQLAQLVEGRTAAPMTRRAQRWRADLTWMAGSSSVMTWLS